MTINDFIVMERPGERTKAMPNALRLSMNRDYAAELVRRLTEKLAEPGTGDVEGVVILGELVEK